MYVDLIVYNFLMDLQKNKVILDILFTVTVLLIIIISSEINLPGWTWAEKLLLTVVEFHECVDIICTPRLGDVRRFSISLPKPEPETFGSRSLGRATDRKRYSIRADTVSNKFKTVRGNLIVILHLCL